MIRTVVWNEHVHERENPVVREIYPEGIHGAIAAGLAADPGIEVSTATLEEPEHGLPADRLRDTDVLLWWGHKAHGDVDEAIVDRVAQRVHEGMGLIVLHSGHFSKIFKRLMGTPCSLRWREAGERERLWSVNWSHPILRGLGDRIELPSEEMYGEPFLVPEPMETILISWF
jgi:trehalose utilization protein